MSGTGWIGLTSLAAQKTALAIPWTKDIINFANVSFNLTAVALCGSTFTVTSGLELETAIIPLGMYVSINNLSAGNGATNQITLTWWKTNQSAGSEIVIAPSGNMANLSQGYNWKNTTIQNSGTGVSIAAGTMMIVTGVANVAGPMTVNTLHVRLVGKLA